MTHHSTLLSRDVLPDEIDQDPAYSPETLKFMDLFGQLVRAKQQSTAVALIAASSDHIAEIIVGACIDAGALTEAER